MKVLRRCLSFLRNCVLYILVKNKYKINIKNTEETLRDIIDNKKSISRFGDGEFSLAFGESLKFQKYSPEIERRYKEILSADPEKTKKCHVAIPYVYSSFKGITLKSMEFWAQYYRVNKKNIYSLLNPNYEYADAQITRIYINRRNKEDSRKYFNLWKSLWKDKDVLLVEGELSRFGVGNDLFDGVNSLQRILCPPSDAFDCYDKILESITKNGQNKLILLVLGPTATILAYDLAQLGYWAVDAGNLDMEYEWLNQGAKEQIAVTGKYTHEAKDGNIVQDNKDEKYIAQIIDRIGV